MNLLLFLTVFSPAFTGGVRAAQLDLKAAGENLTRALHVHQDLYDDARKRVGVSEQRTAALNAFRQSVAIVRESLTEDAVKSAKEKLSELETFLGPEGLQILLHEDLEQLETLLPLVKNSKDRKELQERLQSLSRSSGWGRNELSRLIKSFRESMDEAWQPGVSTLSFGRFGWQNNDGLLCENVSFSSIKTSADFVRLGRISDADMEISSIGCDVAFPETSVTLSLSPAGTGQIKSQVTGVNWIGKTFSVTSADGHHLGAIWTTLQRPATRFSYRLPEVRCSLRGVNLTASSMWYTSDQGLRETALTNRKIIKTTGRAALAHPWLLLDLTDSRSGENFQVVLQLRHRLKQIEVEQDALILTAAEGMMGDIWLFRPMGIGRNPRPKTGAGATPSATQLDRIEGLCQLNLAWPQTCREFFRLTPDGNAVVVRNEVEFEIVQDDWKTEPDVSAAVPPLVMLAKSYIKKDIPIIPRETDWELPTKFGPFATIKGSRLEYQLPIPPLNRHGLFAVEGQDRLVKELQKHFYYQGNRSYARWAVDINYLGITSLLQSFCYATTPQAAEKLDLATTTIKDKIRPEKFWKTHLWRMEPNTRRRYCYDYPGGTYGTRTLADIDWGNSLSLYGLDTWAAYTGNWKTLDQAWPQVWALTDYLVKSHDWAWMADSISEKGEGAAIDCLTATYAGLVATARICETLGKDWERDRILYLLAKTALPHTMRFPYLAYVKQHDLWHDDSPGIGTVNGFHEHGAWIHPTHVGPWWGACSLSGQGVEAECFDALFGYVGAEPLQTWWNMVEKIYPKWYDGSLKYPNAKSDITKGNSADVTIPIIYLKFRLGESTEQLTDWYWQARCNWKGIWQAPNVLAAIASRDCPVQVFAWGKCTLEKPHYDTASGIAHLLLANSTKTDQTVVLGCQTVPETVTLNGQQCSCTSGTDAWGRETAKVQIPPGRRNLEIVFPKSEAK